MVSAVPVVTTPSPSLTGQSILGTGVVGAYIKVYRNTVFAFQVQVNGSGAWSITPQTSGTYEFSQEESGKDESAKTTASIVNQSQSEPPTVTSNAPFYINELISGQAIWETVVKVYKNNVYLETIEFLASDGSFGYVPTSVGSYQFTRTDTDRTESVKTAAVNVTEPQSNVSALPTVTTPSPTVTGQSIIGTGVPNAYIKVYVNTVFAFQVQVNGSGAWSITPQTSGTYEFAQEESGKQESAKTAPSVVNQAQSEVPVVTSTAPFYVNAVISGQAIFDTVVKVYKDTIYIETIEFLASDGSFGYVPTLTGSYQFTRTDLDRLESEKSAAVNVINLPSSALPVVLTPSPIPFGSPISGTGVVNSVIRVYRSLSLVDTVLVNSNGYWVYNPVLVGAYSFSQTQNGLSESDLTAVYTVDDSNPVYKAINVDAESRCDNAMQYAISLTSQNVNTILESQWQDSSLFTGLRVGLLVNIFARKKDKPNEKVYLGQIMTTLSNQITTY